MLTHLLEALAEDDLTAGLLSRELPPVLIRGGPGSRRFSAIFLDPGGEEPAMFVKIAVDTTDRRRIEREHDTLASLAKLPALQSSVPQPIVLMESAAGLLGVQRGVRGSTIAARLRRRWRRPDVGADVAPVLAWLDLFQETTRAGERPALDAEAFERRLHAETGNLGVALGWPEQARRVARLRVPDVRGVSSRGYPKWSCHGDFWTGNVLMHGQDVRVVDWEHSAVGFTPTHDLFTFLISHSAVLPPRPFGSHSTVDGFVVAFVAPGRRRDEYTAVATRFIGCRGLATTDLPVLLVDFLLAMIESPPFGESEEWRAMLRAYLSREESG